MCLKIILKSFFMLVIILMTSSSMVFGISVEKEVDFVESNFSNIYFFSAIENLVKSADISRVNTIGKQTSSIADFYLKNMKSKEKLDMIKWYNGHWIIKEEISPNSDILNESINRSNKYQMIGRLSIPDVNINVALFKTNAQDAVDAKDSAAYFKSGDTYVIADHWYSGFERIRDCKKGTSAFVDTGAKVTEYVCTEVILGHNTSTDLTDLNYVSVLEGRNPNGITLYTCVNGWKNIRIAFFEPKW